MSIAVVLVIAGLVLLVVGGELLVRGATAVAGLAGISPSVVGLTIVAAGTSMPELMVSVDAALSGSTELSVGNVVGSNIFNIAAILGIGALIAPLRITGNAVRLEWPVMLLASGQLYFLARDGAIDRLEGGFFVAALVLFIAYTVRVARTAVAPAEAAQIEAELHELPAEPEPNASGWARSLAVLLVGCAILAIGAHLLVEGAVEIAGSLGVSKTVIGLTVVAAGTSLPELATSVMASIRGHDDMAVANVIGSNIFNVLGIAGATALVHPLPVPAEVLDRDLLWMLGLSALMFPLMWTGLRINRAEGAVLFAGFAAYMAVLLVG